MYKHTQRSPLHLLLYLPVAFSFVLAWQIRTDVVPSIVTAIVAVVLLLLALAFQTLTVSDHGQHLDVRYGPLNLFGTRIAYRDITEVEAGKTSFIDGWGIHFVPFRGWTLNLWGFECAMITRGDKTMRIGTDDSQALVELIKEKMKNS